MALTGIHVVCGYPGDNVGSPTSSFPLMGEVVWSQTFTTAGTTDEAAPRGGQKNPIFQVYAAVDCYVAVAPVPNAGGNQRHFVSAGERYEFYGEGGEKLAWVAA